MTDHADPTRAANSMGQTASRLGFWTAFATVVCAAAAMALAVVTPPRSGPFCPGPGITYPYTDAAAFVPRDYLWMYPGFFLGPLLVVLVACIHHNAPSERRLFSRIGLSFASIAAAVLGIDYFIQLAVMQPSLLKGELEHLSLFSQYNPHGIFIALEDLGYLMMSVAFLFIAAAFAGRARLERAIRWLFVVGFVLAIGSLVVLSLLYGLDIEYRFECAVILIDWTVLVASGVMLSVFFKRAWRRAASG
jgi:hypothetical protein